MTLIIAMLKSLLLIAIAFGLLQAATMFLVADAANVAGAQTCPGALKSCFLVIM